MLFPRVWGSQAHIQVEQTSAPTSVPKRPCFLGALGSFVPQLFLESCSSLLNPSSQTPQLPEKLGMHLIYPSTVCFFCCFLVCGWFVCNFNRFALEVSLPGHQSNFPRIPKEDACVERFATVKGSFVVTVRVWETC